MPARPRFRALDAGLVRLTAHHDTRELGPWPDLTGQTSAHVPGWRDWLRRVWEGEHLVEAIEVASSHLARAVAAVCAGQETRPRHVRRTVESVARYLLRMHSRATPFGHFAGVAPARLGTRAQVHAGEQVPVARPDPVWLAAALADLEARPDILRRLTVVANTLGGARGERWVLPWQQRPGEFGELELGEVSLRRTRAVQAALEAARSPITVENLAEKVAAELCDVTRERVDPMLATLVAQGVLITPLHPPMTSTDPLGRVIDQLTAARSGAERGDTVARWRAVREQLTRYGEATSPPRRRAIRTAATRCMQAIRTAPEPRLAVDLRAGEGVELPSAVAREAERAAAALVDLSPHPSGTSAWCDYHGRFLERYGSGAVVPLGELTHPDTGLGFPAGYRGSSTATPPGLSERDRGLLRLAQQAALEQRREVTLGEEDLAALVRQTTETTPDGPPHTELRFHLYAPNTAALDRGAFTLVVDGASRQAGALSGRFLHLLEPRDRERMMRALSGLPCFHPDATLAQLSCPPLAARNRHVACAPGVFPRISLGEHPGKPDDELAVEDLAVGGDERHLFLVSLSQGCVVEPVMLNAVALRHATHPLARFLCEITTARAAVCTPFSWGAAEELAFLPRLRHRRTVLAPARWRVSVAELPGPTAPWRDWEQAWSHLSRRRGLPARVFLGEHERRLGLDLDEPAHRALLRRHLDRAGHADLAEAPDARAMGWIGDRAHEIVLPLAATRPQAPRRSGPAQVRRHDGHLPGASPWLYTRLHAHPACQTDILTGHLPALLADWHEGPADAAWFLRYREPDPHLRLRLRLHEADHYGAGAQRLGVWARHLQERGLLQSLVLDTYRPEVGRFGTGTAMQAAEAAFAADSAATLAQLTLTTSGGASPQALTAASLINLAAAFTGGFEAVLDWLIAHPRTHPGRSPSRELRAETLRLVHPDQGLAILNALSGGESLLQAWQWRRTAVAAYRAHLTEPGGPDPDQVLASLLHLHHTRVVGIDRESEHTCHHLARAAALSLTARRERSTPSPS
ncbi:thiopeptide-type bacteriocin biosynthesis protein [Lipingzhangella halophila]|uniref:Thiopeptide-type bacteriocin biosynthesis protein n=1 Tax=Lipingzhangella halophila TaxID=1783352 RepID=A0A7W7REY2_9ACTN|nr:lantibiotic dehydratase [Lipingzhangella halophila]MBB4930700.1 thiopeptide-type bacteriocin biosynthesis protein [Lipingzhangella halophila]